MISGYFPACGHNGDYVVGQGTDMSKYYCAICRIKELESYLDDADEIIVALSAKVAALENSNDPT